MLLLLFLIVPLVTLVIARRRDLSWLKAGLASVTSFVIYLAGFAGAASYVDDNSVSGGAALLMLLLLVAISVALPLLLFRASSSAPAHR